MKDEFVYGGGRLRLIFVIMDPLGMTFVVVLWMLSSGEMDGDDLSFTSLVPSVMEEEEDIALSFSMARKG